MLTPSSLSQLSHAEKADLSVLQFEVTEHHAMQAICSCGHVHTAEFPADVNATVQNGPRAQAAMVHLSQNHAVSVQRTAALTWMGCQPKRGGEAFESMALLQQFKGVLIHDGWMPYKALPCQHAPCNAHHLRELTYLLEEQGQAWAGDT